MTLKLRTHEEIQSHVLHPVQLAVLKKIAGEQVEWYQGKRTTEATSHHKPTITKMLLTAAFGAQAFGEKQHGPVFRSVAQLKPHKPLGGKKLAIFADKLLEGSNAMKWAMHAIEPDKLQNFTLEEKHAIIHLLKGQTIDLVRLAQWIKKRKTWPEKF